MRTVSDTSPVSNLAVIKQLGLLRQQFDKVSIPEAVFSECRQIGHSETRELILDAIREGWLIVQPVIDITLVNILLARLHRGEAEAIALAIGIDAELLLIDEREGRQAAREVGLNVRGVLGILLRAKRTGGLSAIRPSIEMLKTHARFFIAHDLEAAILKESGE
jgi:predicted nucleic acid-binding protein